MEAHAYTHYTSLLCFAFELLILLLHLEFRSSLRCQPPPPEIIWFQIKKKYAKMGIRSPVQAVSIESGCKLYLELELRNIC